MINSAHIKLNRRQQILDVAAGLFAQHGVQLVTTRKIAEAVGISQPSLYAHFTSVHQIHEELSAHAFGLLEASARKALDAGLDADALLTASIADYFDFSLSHPVAYRIAFMIEYPVDKEMSRADYDAADHPGPRAFAHLLEVMAVVRPDLGSGDRDLLAKLLWASMHGLVSLLLARPGFPWGDRHTLIATHMKCLKDMVVSYAC
jgi:AcrR family transcriptional regulator